MEEEDEPMQEVRRTHGRSKTSFLAIIFAFCSLRKKIKRGDCHYFCS